VPPPSQDTGENYPLVQRRGKVLRSIDPAMDLYNSPSIECPPKNLMVDSIFFQLRSTNYSRADPRARGCVPRGGGRDIVVCENVGIF
jgi:hypothetical protein